MKTTKELLLFANEITKLLDIQIGRKKTLEDEYKCDIISLADMLKELDMINKKELKLKRTLVSQVHVKKNGLPKSIRYDAVRDLWITKISGDIRIHARTEESLLDKILEYYDCHLMSYTIDHIFTLALKHKEDIDICSPLTIQRYKDSYNRFISEEFREKDIRKVDNDSLQSYSKLMTARLHPKKKAFLSYKGVLNLIFDYAEENNYIQNNPVKSINNKKFLMQCDNSKPQSSEKILSLHDIEAIYSEINRRNNLPRYQGYFYYGYMVRMAIATGMRAGELCALKWADIDDYYIHIHAQQLTDRGKGNTANFYADWTKDEKGISHGGRKFPITDNIAAILDDLKKNQLEKNIISAYVFCKPNGDWIKIGSYHAWLREFMKSINLPVTNNHAFRISINSNVFIPNGIPVTDRARLLGHSVETNIKHYSYARIGVDQEIIDRLNGKVAPKLPQNIIDFESTKKKKA